MKELIISSARASEEDSLTCGTTVTTNISSETSGGALFGDGAEALRANPSLTPMDFGGNGYSALHEW